MTTYFVQHGTSGPICKLQEYWSVFDHFASSGSVTFFSFFFFFLHEQTSEIRGKSTFFVKPNDMSPGHFSHHGSLHVMADDLVRYLSNCTEEEAHSLAAGQRVAMFTATRQVTCQTTVVFVHYGHQPLVVTYKGYKSNDSMCEKNGSRHSPYGALEQWGEVRRLLTAALQRPQTHTKYCCNSKCRGWERPMILYTFHIVSG